MKKLLKKETLEILERIERVDNSTPTQEIEEIITSWFNQECDESWERNKQKKEIGLAKEYGLTRDYSGILLFNYPNTTEIKIEKDIYEKIMSLSKRKNLTQKSIDVLFVNALMNEDLEIVEYILLNHPCERMKKAMKYWDFEDDKILISGFGYYSIEHDYNVMQSDEIPGLGLWSPRIEKEDYFHLMEVINNK